MTARKGEVILPVWDRTLKRWVVTRQTGRVFDVDGRELELFPISVLASTIKKTGATIRSWERQGKFPKPMFKVPSSGPHAHRRWYSKVQIANVRAVYKKYPSPHSGPNNILDVFLDEVRKVFYNLERTDDAKGGDVR